MSGCTNEIICMRTRINQDVGDGGVYASIYVSSWCHCETRLDHVCHILHGSLILTPSPLQ